MCLMIEGRRLERRLRSSEHFLLLRRTWVQPPTIHNPSSRRSDSHRLHVHTCRQNMQKHKVKEINTKKKKVMEGVPVKAWRTSGSFVSDGKGLSWPRNVTLGLPCGAFPLSSYFLSLYPKHFLLQTLSWLWSRINATLLANSTINYIND